MEFATLERPPQGEYPAIEQRASGGAGFGGDAPPVTQAFGLGWNLARLFVSNTAPAQPKHEDTPDRLPSPGSLSEAERSHIRLGQIRVAIEDLDGKLGERRGGTTLGEAASEELEHLLPAADGEAGCTEPRARLFDSHLGLGQALSCCDGRLSKAYHLGVALATTCYAPTDMDSLSREFDPHRTAQIGEWLADLTALFPDHSCRAVRLSCNAWRLWVKESEGQPGVVAAETASALQKVKAKATGKALEVDPAEEWTEVRRTLARQGEVWRALLSEEKLGTAMLELRDYVGAAGRALGNGFVLVKRFWWAGLLALLFLAGGTALVLLDKGPGVKALGLASVISAVGIVWKGIGGGIGAVAAKLRDPVWGAALDEEIAEAITVLPGDAKAVTEKARDAAPASGPPPSKLALHEEVEDNQDWAP